MTGFEIDLPILLSLPPLLAAFFALRLSPVWQDRNQGCDAYYFMLCAEEFRRRPRLPIRLPRYYLLEERDQYYPPGFSIFCALFPPKVLDRFHWLLNHVVDSILFVTVFFWVSSQFGLAFGWAAGLIYAGGPLVLEYRGLTSRPMGVLLLTIVVIATWFWVNDSLIGFAIALLACIVLLYTHKLSTQLLWFMIPFLAIVEWEPAWFLPVLSAYAVALLIGRGFFVDILRTHVDIVSFWHRNWRLLGAHLVRQSPVYGDDSVDTSVHTGAGLRSAVGYVVSIIRNNYFAVMVPVALLDFPALPEWERFFVLWCLAVFCWAFLTLYVPWLRSLGLGTLYIKYAHFPSLALTAGILTRAESVWPWLLAAICLIYNIRFYWKTVHAMRESGWQSTGALSGGLAAMVDRLREFQDPRILCIPTHIADSVAYHTRQPVLWGTHGFGFKRIEPIFPVLRISLAEVVSRMGATHLLLDRRYVDPSELRIDASSVVAQAEHYLLFPLGNEVSVKVDAEG